MTAAGDPYRELGLTPGASANEIRSAYRRLAKQFHPDAAGERALPRFLAIQAAYERLIDVDGELRSVTGRPGRPGPAWAADPDRARATRDAYRARRAGWTSPRARRSEDAAGRPGAAGPADGTGGAERDGLGEEPRTGRRGRSGGSGRRTTRKATQGSTTYDEAAETPRDPSWQGAGWYGPASGTFWTINPKEYADPRKHGPEYQARARRAVEDEQAKGQVEGEGPVPRPVTGAGGTDAAGTDAGWQWAARNGRATGSARTTTDAGVEHWAAEGWSYRPESDVPPDAHARRAFERFAHANAAEPSDPLPDVEALISRLSPRNLRAHAARGDIRTRVLLALIAWPPIGFGVATVIGDLSGCASFSAGCLESASWLSTAAQPVIVALLVLLPALAAILAFATLGTLAVSITLGLLLGLMYAQSGEAGRGVLGVAVGATYLIALAFAVVHGRRGRRVPDEAA